MLGLVDIDSGTLLTVCTLPDESHGLPMVVVDDTAGAYTSTLVRLDGRCDRGQHPDPARRQQTGTPDPTTGVAHPAPHLTSPRYTPTPRVGP